MDRNKIRKLQLSQCAILNYLDDVCSNLDINYFLLYGSLLGAIRHEGFIPWDPDLDIGLLRHDYERLIEYLLTQPNEYLFLDHYKTDPCHISPHAILRIRDSSIVNNKNNTKRYYPLCDGIYIDIFPFDVITDDTKKLRKQTKEVQFIRRITSLKLAPTYGNQTSKWKKTLKTIVSILLTPITFSCLLKKLDKVQKRYNHEDSGLVGSLTDEHSFTRNYKYEKKMFQAPERTKFETYEFCIPHNSDKFLKITYGDYMKLPPESERWKYLDNEIDDVVFGNDGYIKFMNDYGRLEL